MDVFADKMGRIGAWCGQNKYLSAIKNAFQNFMPATIAGAIGILWTNVLVNQSTGLGALWEPIMVLEVLNPIFAAIQFATISCITVGITVLLAQEIGTANGENGVYPAMLGFILWLIVTPTTQTLPDFTNIAGEIATFTGISGDHLGATGLFTGMLVAIVGLEIYNFFRKMEAIKIKMPEQVPPGVAKAFEVLIPTLFSAIVIGAISLIVQLTTDAELNALIFNTVQQPLSNIIGNNIFAVMILYIIIMLFWFIGIHGVNMVSGVRDPIFKPLLYANMAAYQENKEVPNVINLTMMETFGQFGGSGVTLGLIIAIILFSKREENRTIATLSVVPGLFNINETVTFGMPLVLNPILGIPFILGPALCIFVGWGLTMIGFCPKIVLEVPWTTPPLIQGFLATGGSIQGAITQLLLLVLCTLIYIPFLFIYERSQAKEELSQ
ncbi:MAG: PTS sugar transporter subunit IIC [Coprobacillaceae bacterium]